VELCLREATQIQGKTVDHGQRFFIVMWNCKGTAAMLRGIPHRNPLEFTTD
jgi:hypothetical protein